MTEHTLTDLIFEALKLHYHETDRRAAEYLAGLVRYAIPARSERQSSKSAPKRRTRLSASRTMTLAAELGWSIFGDPRHPGTPPHPSSVLPLSGGWGMSETIEKHPHPWYGPCDGFGPGGECAECTGLIESSDGSMIKNDDSGAIIHASPPPASLPENFGPPSA
jgi:hypothetical protein